MKAGINLLNYSVGATPESLLARARIAESMGFHSVMISDHVAITPSVRPRYPEPFFDPFTTLAWLAGQTSRVRLGTTVCVVPYRHPVLAARLVANIDRLSGGRFIFGVGVGGAADEFAALGLPFHRRGAMVNEYLEVMRQLWTQPTVTYAGQFVDLESVSGIRCAEMALDLRDAAVTDDSRAAGVGSLDQVRDDLKALEALGAQHVILDWYVPGDFETARDDARAWRMLTLLAHEVLDLPGELAR